MRTRQNWIGIMLIGVLSISTVALPSAVHASEEGKKNTAIALGVGAVALLLTQKNKLPGLVVAGAAAVAYKGYSDDVSARHRREREWGNYRYEENCPHRERREVRDRISYRDRDGDAYRESWEGDTVYTDRELRCREENRRRRDTPDDGDTYRFRTSYRNRDENCEEKNDYRSRNERRYQTRNDDEECRTRDPRLRDVPRDGYRAAERLNRRRSANP